MISAFSGGVLTVAGSVVIGAALPAFRRYRAVPGFAAASASADAEDEGLLAGADGAGEGAANDDVAG